MEQVDRIAKIRHSMELKLKSIPTPMSSRNHQKSVIRKNREIEAKNLEHTKKIMRERRKEAIEEGDLKKKIHSVMAERDQVGQYGVNEGIYRVTEELDMIRKAIDDSDFKVLEFFSDLNNPKFWEDDNFKDSVEKGKFYKAMGFNPRTITKFFQYIETKKKLVDLQKRY